MRKVELRAMEQLKSDNPSLYVNISSCPFKFFVGLNPYKSAPIVVFAFSISIVEVIGFIKVPSCTLYHFRSTLIPPFFTHLFELSYYLSSSPFHLIPSTVYYHF